MNIKGYALCLFLFCFIITKAEIPVEVNDSNEQEEIRVESETKAFNYLEYLYEQVSKVNQELVNNRNMRATTPLSLHDIAFGITRDLPRWIYPPSIWKQSQKKRRLNLSKFLSEAYPEDRKQAFSIQEKATEWARKYDKQFKEYWIKSDREIEEIFLTLEDFIKEISHSNIDDINQTLKGYTKIEGQMSRFLKTNMDTFINMMKEVNKDFDSFISPSGEIRIVVESIRYEAVEKIKSIGEEWYKKAEGDLKKTSQDLQSCLRYMMFRDLEPKSVIETKAKILSELQTSLSKRNTIHADHLKYRKQVQSIWKQVVSELNQSPFKIDYWVDAYLDVKQAAIKLAKIAYRKTYRYTKAYRYIWSL